MSTSEVILDDRRKTRKIVTDYLETYNRDRILVLKGYAGLGKTFISMDTLFNKDMINIYLAPTHNLCSEIEGQFSVKHMKGKKFECINSERNPLKSHCDTNYYCTNICPYFYECDYFNKMRDLYSNCQSWVGVHSHIPNLFNNYTNEFLGLVDMNVIDETFSNSMIVKKEITKFMLKNMILMTNYTKLNNLLFEILNIMEDPNKLYDSVKIYNYIISLNEKRLDKESKNVNVYITDCYLRHEDISQMYNFIGNIMELKDFLILNENSDSYIKFFDNHFDLLYFKQLSTTGSTILLDATFETELNKVFFPKGTNFEIVTMKEVYSMNQKIYQFKGNKRFTYPLTTLYRKDKFTSSFNFLCKLTNLIVQKHIDDKTLIVARKKYGVKDKIHENFISNGIECKDKIYFGNFGGLRGLNEYEECNTCIIFGTPFPNSNYVNRLSNVLNVDSRIIDKSMKEDEIIQDIFRIRPMQKKCNIYVLSSVKVFENDHDVMYMTPNEMLKMLDKKLLTNSSSYGRIYKDLFMLMSNEMIIKKSDVFRRIKGDDKLIRQVIDDMINKKVLVEELMKRGKRGRPSSYLRLL